MGKFLDLSPCLDLSQEQFMEAFARYQTAILIQFKGPKISQDVTLAIEKEAMLSYGRTFSFAMVLCVACEECAHPGPCRYPHLARPSMDAYGIDIGKTVESLGFTVEFDKEGKLIPAWYSMVLL